MDKWKEKTKKNLIKFYQELEQVCQKFKRDPKSMSVLFATKYLTSEQLPEFIKVYKDFRSKPLINGENRVQDAEAKFRYLEYFKGSPCSTARAALAKVFIGNLQTNKINKALVLFDE